MMDQADELVRFFESLPESARREYSSLAELDRRFGEDIEGERRARPSAGRPAPTGKP